MKILLIILMYEGECSLDDKHQEQYNNEMQELLKELIKSRKERYQYIQIINYLLDKGI